MVIKKNYFWVIYILRGTGVMQEITLRLCGKCYTKETR